MANCLTHISVHCPGLRQATFVSVELMYVGSQQPVEKGSQALGAAGLNEAGDGASKLHVLPLIGKD